MLNRAELERSPLADLHAIASEVGVGGFRRLRREELVAAIVEHAGGEGEAGDPGDAAEAGEEAGRRSGTGGRRGRGRAAEAEPPEAEKPSNRPGRGRAQAAEARAGPADESLDEQEAEVRAGTLDVLPNGAGFLRDDALAPGRDDPHVSPAQIRRCELRPGDEVRGPVRPPRRSERHPSLVRVETVNGEPAEPPPDRPRFEAATPAYAIERLTVPDELAAPPFGRGSRVAIVDPQGAEGGALLRRLVAALGEAHPDLERAVALAGARPEEVPEWRRAEVALVGGSADGPIDDQAQAAELALERAKRVAERGGHALLAVDSLGALQSEVARRLFATARRLEESGTLTVIAAVGANDELAGLATTRIVLEPAAGPRGDEPPKVAPTSHTVRADLLVG